MRLKTFKFILISAILHGFVLLYLFHQNIESSKVNHKEKVELEIVEADAFIESQIDEVTPAANRLDPQANNNTAHKPATKLKNFFPELRPGSISVSEDNSMDPRGQSFQEIARRQSIQQVFETQYFYKALALRLDSHVGYPQELIEARIDGKLVYEIKVNHLGVLQSIIPRRVGNNKTLQAYTLASIYASLQSPLEERHYASEGLYTLLVTIDFQVETLNQNQSEFSVQGADIALTRVGHSSGSANQFLSRFVDRYLPPVVIYPGGVYVDFVRLYQMIEKWDEMDPEVLQAERLRMLGEAFEISLKKHEADFQNKNKVR